MNSNFESKAIGVISAIGMRSEYDTKQISDLPCGRKPSSTMVEANSIGIIGPIDERSVKDRALLAMFSCKNGSRENYTLKPVPGVTGSLIEPRSVMDDAMLAKFNSCACKEGFEGPSCSAPKGVAVPNPYNSSGNIRYVPIQ